MSTRILDTDDPSARQAVMQAADRTRGEGRGKPYACAAAPCGSCPYRLEHPSGVWAADHYEALREFNDQSCQGEFPSTRVFLCHQTNASGKETLCRGWLTVERESLAVQLALLLGRITEAQLEPPIPVPLHPTGAAAAAAGLVDIDAPGPEARRMQEQLLAKGAGRPAE